MKPCILLIEDDQDMRDLVAGHLEHTGFDVQRAEDGIKGQALALQYKPCILYTSDSADEGLGLDLGGRRIIKNQ